MSADLRDVPEELREAVTATLMAAAVDGGHLSVELVSEGRIRELNRDHRGRDAPTDVLAFPVDGAGQVAGPRELGDVVICPEHATDVREAAIHGVLHLCGYDHETDGGEMLALQAKVIGAVEDPAEPDMGASPPRPPSRRPPPVEESAGMTRAGFVGVVGRPNVGKSTLANAIVGAKVAIVSDRPQTTRRAIRGIATDPVGEWQLVLVDLPGVQRPRDEITKRMQSRVESELHEADAVLLVIDGEQGVGPGDRFIAGQLIGAGERPPVVCAVNKVDRLSNAETAAVLSAAGELGVADEIVPTSAKRGTGIGVLVERLVELVPEGPLMYPPEDRTDASREQRVAELIREQVLRRTRQEVPHSVEVMVNEIGTRDDGLIEIHADTWVETESQKGILVGRGGKMVRDVGTAARRELERELGARVYLDLQVKVRPRWRRDTALLDRLGIE